MNHPSELKYTREHEWVRLHDDGTATIGITDYAQNELGEIVFVEIEMVGKKVDKEIVFGTIEAVKTVSELFMPLTGKILEWNESLEDQPELINEDPYDKGWMIKISVDDSSELDELLSSEEYKEIIA